MASNLVEWKTFIAHEYKPNSSDRVLVKEHPLRNVIVTERIPRRILGSTPSTGRTTPVSTSASILEPLTLALKQLDPLSEFTMQEMDPLSKMAAEMEATDSKLSHTSAKVITDSGLGSMEPWSTRKQAILSKYTTSEKLSIWLTKFNIDLNSLTALKKAPQRKFDLSQAEYVGRIEQLSKELVSAWHSEQRVKALKIAIQCAKLLADTDVLPFYPSKFVLITDILDTFGKLVYDRLRTKADYYKPGAKTPTPLPEDFTAEMVPESAKETCLNWFYKIASIRELVPRLYVEIALLKSYNFISSHECPEALLKITDMIHGIGNPLVAIYVRCYLCRVGINVTPTNSSFDFLLANFTRFLESYQHLFSRSVTAELISKNMPISTYMSLYLKH
ncbi:hypothetical protein NQ317_016126 [Molorchus minor]|uniref:Uncharacterized protein n=1 Tax=Molorchus minor TaxID=1323400 RepID=A0ABQ9J960_9CUCU|nr:hypothetical protein NQ317_016126 [Molorchus minor]